MDLFSLSLIGYRRFRTKAHLRTNGRVVALVGPNEAGKTSILRALSSLNDEEAFSVADHARGVEREKTEIVAKFLLDDQEASDAGLVSPSWMLVHKEHDGTLTYNFDPEAPERDTTHRSSAIRATKAVLSDRDWIKVFERTSEELPQLLEDAVPALEASGPDLEDGLLETIKEIGEHWASIDAERLTRFPKYEKVARAWSRMAECETGPNPFERALEALRPRVPEFLLFDEADRNLASSYPMDELTSVVPQALQALLNVARIDIKEVTAAVTREARDDLTTLERRANRTLEAAFKEAWRQSAVTVALRLSTDLLEIQIVDEDERYTRLAERSDGLRQFVALHAFIAQSHADAPILLIDEAEQRLHYDAQADLVQMLARQRLASKVLYTTHSAGCLPEDLGHGVRLVEPVKEHPATSHVVNKFWAGSGGGFSPLLFGLGATTMAFFPTRRAVCVEGPGDLLLLPAMLREAMALETLGYQIVPGLSSAVRTLAPVIPAEAANVAFLVDGDDGGRAISTKLIEGGIPAAQILHLASADGHAIELEDFLDPKLLVDAVNRILVKFLPGATPIRRGDLRRKHRTKFLRARYAEAVGREIDKVEVAYEILDLVDADPKVQICDATRRDELADIGRRIAATFA